MPTPPRPPTASRVLWPLTALLALVGVVVLALGMAGSAGRVTSDMVGFHGDQQVQVPEDGMSVWSRSPDSRTEVVCLLDGTPLLRPVSDFSVEVAGQRFHETARTTQDLAAGTYALECNPAQAPGDDQAPAQDAPGAADGRLYVGPYGPGAVATGLLGGTGVTLGLVLLPLALVCGVLAWAAGRRQPTTTDDGPDPAAYHVPEQGARTAYTSPYATPRAPQPSTQHPPYAPVAPPSGLPDGAPPFPTGGPFAGGLPPRPVSTGHDDAGDGPHGQGPPNGPRYDLPPPS